MEVEGTTLSKLKEIVLKTNFLVLDKEVSLFGNSGVYLEK
jgi:hypothetical protein